MPSMTKSPWAKLARRMIPKISDSPADISAYTPPSAMPLVSARRKDTCPPLLAADLELAGGLARRVHRDDLAVLPLGEEDTRVDVLADAVELDPAAGHPRRGEFAALDVDAGERVPHLLRVARLGGLQGISRDVHLLVAVSRVACE